MKTIITTILALVSYFLTYGQTSYTWNVPSGLWTSPSSWSPARTTPAANDILIFNGSVILYDTVTGFAKDAAGRLRIINNAQVIIQTSVPTTGIGTITRLTSSLTINGSGTQFTSQMIVGDGIYTGAGSNLVDVQSINNDSVLTCSSSGTAYTAVTYSIMPRLTLSGGTNPSLEIQNGSTLTCSGNAINNVTIYLANGATASIKGIASYTNGRHRIIAADSNAVVFSAGGMLTVSGGYNGSPFSLVGRRNIVKFDSGSVFYSSVSVTPFGLSSPDSKVFFLHGSTYRHESSSLPTNLFNGRIFDLFILNASAFNNTTIPINLGCTVDTLQILSATALGFNSTTAGTLNILGALLINSGTFSIGTGTATHNLNLIGTSGIQIIGGTGGTINIGNNTVVSINNPAGMRIDRSSLIIPKTLVMSQGNINLNSNTLILGNFGVVGKLTYTSGRIVGPGTLTRWLGVDTLTMGNDSGRFPLGTASADRSLWISGTPTTGGTVSVTYNNVSGRTIFSTPFADNATNAVTVKVRQKANWVVSTGNGFAGTGLSLRVQGSAAALEVTNPTNLRLTLGTGVAPGTAVDGGGTNGLPQANRSGLNDTNLNNTFYFGGDSLQNPLPVQLMHFKAMNMDPSTVYLVWQSASELNADRYEIEKSYNGNIFEFLSSVKAKGNSSTEQSYEATDGNAFKNNNLVYFRLKLVDLDGSFQYSNLVSVKKNEIKNSINIINAVPNPTSGDIGLNIYSTQFQQAKIEIIDLKGSIIYTSEKILDKGDNTFSINMNLINSGVYFVRLTGANEVTHFRIMKN